MVVVYPSFPEPTDNEKEFQESALRIVAEHKFNLPYYRTFMFIDGVRYRLTIQREDKARGEN